MIQRFCNVMSFTFYLSHSHNYRVNGKASEWTKFIYIYILCPCSNMAILPDCANSIVGQDEWSKIWFNQLSPKWTNYDANVPFCSSSSSSSFFLLAFCIFAYWQVPLYNKSESSQNVVVIITAFISLCHLWIKLE